MDADPRQAAARAADARELAADEREQRADLQEVSAMEEFLRSGAGQAPPRTDPGD